MAAHAEVEEGVPVGLTRQTYDIGDITQGSGGRGESLARFFTETVAPESWRKGGGRASVRYDARRQQLIVCQTAGRQQEVAALLEVLRGISRQAPQRMPRGPGEPGQ